MVAVGRDDVARLVVGHIGREEVNGSGAVPCARLKDSDANVVEFLQGSRSYDPHLFQGIPI
jgi:hypothetical protein